MEPNRYLLVMVGCLECGESTYAEGSYATEADARAAVPAYCTEMGYIHGPFAIGEQDESEWGGQAVAVIFDLHAAVVREAG